MRPYVVLRALMEVGLLVADGSVLAAIGGAAPDRRERAFALALRARQLVEAMALWRHPTAASVQPTAWRSASPRLAVRP